MSHGHDLKLLAERVSSRLADDPGVKLRELSKEFGIDRHMIERALRETRQIGFRQLKQEVRLAYARKFLGALAVKEVACQLGMSPNALSRFIKAKTGKPPKYHNW